MLLCSSLSSDAAVTHQGETRELCLFLPSCAVPMSVLSELLLRVLVLVSPQAWGSLWAILGHRGSRGLFLLTVCSLHSFPPRTWISTCSPCPRAMASLLSGSLTTALSFPLGPTCSQKTTGTRRTGGSASTSPGTATAPGSPAPAWPRAEPRAGMRASPRWKGENHSGTWGGNSIVPHLFSWLT